MEKKTSSISKLDKQIEMLQLGEFVEKEEKEPVKKVVDERKTIVEEPTELNMFDELMPDKTIETKVLPKANPAEKLTIDSVSKEVIEDKIQEVKDNIDKKSNEVKEVVENFIEADDVSEETIKNYILPACIGFVIFILIILILII